MNIFFQFFIYMIKFFELGELDNYPDPDPPADLGDPLTQDEIDWVKSLKKEMDERFSALP